MEKLAYNETSMTFTKYLYHLQADLREDLSTSIAG